MTGKTFVSGASKGEKSMIVFSCPGCNRPIQVKEEGAGRKRNALTVSTYQTYQPAMRLTWKRLTRRPGIGH